MKEYPDQKLNWEAANNPKAGDFWTEQFSAILVVDSVTETDVYVQMVNRLTSEFEEPTRISRKDFVDYLKYDTLPEKTWCEVFRPDEVTK